MRGFDDWLTTEPDPGPECEVRYTRTARKPWTCADCRRPIDVGDRYTEIRQLMDGSWFVSRICLADRCAYDDETDPPDPEKCSVRY